MVTGFFNNNNNNIFIYVVYAIRHAATMNLLEAGGEIWFRVGPGSHSSQSASNGS